MATIALIAHDGKKANKKANMVAFASQHQAGLANYRLIATGPTASASSQLRASQLSANGLLGGDAQISAEIGLGRW